MSTIFFVDFHLQAVGDIWKLPIGFVREFEEAPDIGRLFFLSSTLLRSFVESFKATFGIARLRYLDVSQTFLKESCLKVNSRSVGISVPNVVTSRLSEAQTLVVFQQSLKELPLTVELIPFLP